jgi:protein gp37
MADTSKIEWTDATWNVVTGCDSAAHRRRWATAYCSRKCAATAGSKANKTAAATREGK